MPAVAWGVDAASKISVATLKQQGASFICCYLAPYPAQGWKMRSPAEWKEYLNAGVNIVANWESDGTPQRGRPSGQEAARTAQQYLKDRGCDDAVVYFTAADKDPSALNLDLLCDYIRGAVDVLGWDRVGTYGGFGAIKYQADRNVCKYFWQTYAWSKGQWDARAQLRQWKNTQTIDYDEAWSADFGQYPRVSKGLPPANSGPAATNGPAVSKTPEQQIYEIFAQVCHPWNNPGPPAGPGNGWPVEMIANTHKEIIELNAKFDALSATYSAVQESYAQVIAALHSVQADLSDLKALHDSGTTQQ